LLRKAAEEEAEVEAVSAEGDAVSAEEGVLAEEEDYVRFRFMAVERTAVVIIQAAAGKLLVVG
jgi:hypothetical protein